MRCLVTGGAGFIGSYLVEALLKGGHEVYVLDDLSSGSLGNLAACFDHPRLHCVFRSVTDPEVLGDLAQNSDVIFHLAAAVGVRLVVEQPLRSMAANIHGTERVLEAASERRTPVFLASTSEVYGKNERVPFREDADLVMGPTTKSRWSYACSKAIDEFLAIGYWREKRLPVVIGRFFNVVGPRQSGRYGMVLPNFVRQALHGEPIQVFGSGEQSRCFCHVAEAVEAVVRLVERGEAVGQVVNIGNDQEATIAQLARLVKERTASSAPIRFIPYHRAYGSGFEDMQRRTPCLQKLRRLTGFRPTKPLVDIIDDVAAFFERKRKVPQPVIAMKKAASNRLRKAAP